MLFDKDKRTFSALKEMKVPAVPTKGDKITINDEDGIGQIYSVYDVHYGDTGVDVNIIYLGNVTDYYSSGYPEIKNAGNDLWWSA